MSRKSYSWTILFGVAVLTLIADRISKSIVVNNLAVNEYWHPSIPFVRRIVSVTHITNTGAAFGLFPNYGVVFVVIAVVVVTAIVFYYRHLPSGYSLMRVALGLQLGGALGNLIDRLRFGYVVDFVDLNFWPLQSWAVFNVADSAIVVGVLLLAVTLLLEDVQDPGNKTGRTESDAASEPGTPS